MGKAAEGILSLSLFCTPQSRTHTDGKFIDLDLQQFSGKKVSELVDGHHNAKKQDSQQDI